MGMARPKEFDVDRALDAALDVFWSKGFEATSMQDLVDGMGINRGSLYDTFGSKDELYRRAFGEYAQRRGEELVGVLDAPGSLRERLRGYLLGLVTEPDGRGCLIVNAACERGFEDADSRAMAAAAMEATIGVLEDAMASAAAGGALRSGVSDDLHVATPAASGSVTVAEWSVVNDDKIASQRIVFDTAAFAALMPQA